MSDIFKIALAYVEKISDVEDVIAHFLTATNTESRSAVEVINLNTSNITSLEEIIKKINEEFSSIYAYSAALEKENAEFKAQLNGR